MDAIYIWEAPSIIRSAPPLQAPALRPAAGSQPPFKSLKEVT
jgi:hypothetical protein